jgi:hypothetical protein
VNHLSQFIVAETEGAPNLKPLPLVHTTSAYTLRQIMDSGAKLRPAIDPVFNDSLLYFFYGKPVYYPRSENSSSFEHLSPVYFLVAPIVVSAARRIYPFDTGAFSAGLFDNYVSGHRSPENFELDLDATSHGAVPFPQTATKFVQAFYGSNRSYFYNSPRTGLVYDPINFEVEIYLNLVNSKETARFDERHATIEIQTTKEVLIDQTTCLAIIIPHPLLGSVTMKRFLESNPGITVKIFPLYRSVPEYLSSLAVSLVGEFLEANGYFG